jgi:hypothetical protein
MFFIAGWRARGSHMAKATAMVTGATPPVDSEGHHREKLSLEGGIKGCINTTVVLVTMVAGVQGAGAMSMAGDMEDREEPWTTMLVMGNSGCTLPHPGTHQRETFDLRNNKHRDMAQCRGLSSRERGHLQPLGVETLAQTWRLEA